MANIHDRGTPAAVAAERVLAFADVIRAAGRSGATVREPDGEGPRAIA